MAESDREVVSVVEEDEEGSPEAEIGPEINKVEEIQVGEIPVPRPVMDNVKLNPPSCMQLTGNLADNWKWFKQRFNICLATSGAGGNDEEVKASIVLHIKKKMEKMLWTFIIAFS